MLNNILDPIHHKLYFINDHNTKLKIVRWELHCYDIKLRIELFIEIKFLKKKVSL